MDIVKQLWEPARLLLKQTGLSHRDYLTELTWLLCLKIAPLIGVPIPAQVSWYDLARKKGWQQLNHYQTLLTGLGQVAHPYLSGIYAQAQTQLKQPSSLAHLISLLEIVDTVVIDDFGELYESLLEYYTRQENNSTHLIPPRPLVDTMTILLQPCRGEVIQDPLAGMGQFLVAADHYIKVIERDNEAISSESQVSHSLFGLEADLSRQRWALMNCLLNRVDTLSRLPVHWDNSLLSTAYIPPADVVLSSLLFTSQAGEFRQQDGCLVMLQHSWHSLKPGGRAAVIIPDTVLKAPGFSEQVRREFLNNCVVHTILRLPLGIFYPYPIAAHVLFFKRSETAQEVTQTIRFYDLRQPMSGFGQYKRLKREHLDDFILAYGDEPCAVLDKEISTDCWHLVSREELAQHQFRLDSYWLQDHEFEEKKLSQFWNLLDNTCQELEILKEVLGTGQGPYSKK